MSLSYSGYPLTSRWTCTSTGRKVYLKMHKDHVPFISIRSHHQALLKWATSQATILKPKQRNVHLQKVWIFSLYWSSADAVRPGAGCLITKKVHFLYFLMPRFFRRSHVSNGNSSVEQSWKSILIYSKPLLEFWKSIFTMVKSIS